MSFVPGDRITTTTTSPSGHTRLPRYLSGRPGVIVAERGRFPLADVRATGVDAAPEPLYTVRFSAADVWGDDAEARTMLHADLWESYLDPG